MGKNKEKLQSKVVDFLRFPLMIGVVIIHSRFTIILQPQMLEYVQTGGIYFYVSWLFSKVIFGICVAEFKSQTQLFGLDLGSIRERS